MGNHQIIQKWCVLFPHSVFFVYEALLHFISELNLFFRHDTHTHKRNTSLSLSLCVCASQTLNSIAAQKHFPFFFGGKLGLTDLINSDEDDDVGDGFELDRTPSTVIEQSLGSGRIEFVEIDSDGKPKNPLVFNDPATVDVVLSFHTPAAHTYDSEPDAKMEVFLHSRVLEQYFFATILSKRWQESRQFSEGPNHEKWACINMTIPSSCGVEPYILVLQLLYAKVLLYMAGRRLSRRQTWRNYNFGVDFGLAAGNFPTTEALAEFQEGGYGYEFIAISADISSYAHPIISIYTHTIHEIMAVGITTSVVLFLLDVTRLMGLVQRLIPLPVVCGIHVSKGLSFAITTVKYVMKNQDFANAYI